MQWSNEPTVSVRGTLTLLYRCVVILSTQRIHKLLCLCLLATVIPTKFLKMCPETFSPLKQNFMCLKKKSPFSWVN